MQDRMYGWYAELLNPDKIRKKSSLVSYFEMKKAGETRERMSIACRRKRNGIALFILLIEHWGDWRCSIGIIYT